MKTWWTSLRLLLGRNLFWGTVLALIVVFTMYWNLLAARRYVSEAHVVVDQIQGPAMAVLPEVPSLLPNASPPRDILLLRDYTLSADMLAKLEAKLQLRDHYSGSYDPFSRLLYRNIAFEWFLQHYRKRVSVEYDEQAGVLVVQAQAYTPEMAHDIARTMVEEGGRFINEMAQAIAREQIGFAMKEVAEAAKRLAQARQALIAFQNKHGLVSPPGAISEISAVIARLESERSDLQARRGALEAYLAPTAYDLVQVTEQIQAVEKELRSQRARLATGNGNALNRVADEYDRLTIEAGFQQAVYQTAVTALERTRLDASRLQRKVSILQQPTSPQYSMEPGRFYNTAVFALGTLFLAGIVYLLMAVIREHRD